MQFCRTKTLIRYGRGLRRASNRECRLSLWWKHGKKAWDSWSESGHQNALIPEEWLVIYRAGMKAFLQISPAGNVYSESEEPQVSQSLLHVEIWERQRPPPRRTANDIRRPVGWQTTRRSAAKVHALGTEWKLEKDFRKHSLAHHTGD